MLPTIVNSYLPMTLLTLPEVYTTCTQKAGTQRLAPTGTSLVLLVVHNEAFVGRQGTCDSGTTSRTLSAGTALTTSRSANAMAWATIPLCHVNIPVQLDLAADLATQQHENLHWTKQNLRQILLAFCTCPSHGCPAARNKVARLARQG